MSQNAVSATHNPTWEARHAQARRHPFGQQERAIVDSINGWQAMAETSRQRGYLMSEDYYFGETWAEIGRALISYLSMDLGRRLDGGSLDSEIADTLAAHGFNREA